MSFHPDLSKQASDILLIFMIKEAVHLLNILCNVIGFAMNASVGNERRKSQS